MPEKKPLPEGFAEKFSGIYYNQGSSFNVEIKDGLLSVSSTYGENKIEVTVKEIRRNQVRIGIQAPNHVKIFRKELYDKSSVELLDSDLSQKSEI